MKVGKTDIKFPQRESSNYEHKKLEMDLRKLKVSKQKGKDLCLNKILAVTVVVSFLY